MTHFHAKLMWQFEFAKIFYMGTGYLNTFLENF